MPDQGYQTLLNHLRELQRDHAQLKPHQKVARERFELRITEAKAAIKAHVRSQLAKRSPRR